MQKELNEEHIEGLLPTAAIGIVGFNVLFTFILTLPEIIDIIEDRYEIKKDFKPKSFSIIKKPNEIINPNYDIVPKIESELEVKKLVNFFIERLKHCFSYQQLNIMFTNLKTIKINICSVPKEKKRQDTITLASYNSIFNMITLSRDNIKTTIFHELFHMSSSIYTNEKDSFCGFHYVNKKKRITIGSGINEGYTELLTKRYFPDFETLNNYEFERLIASKLEEIIGQDIMENLYFNCNLLDLIKELKQYATTEEIMKFITMYDYIEYYDSYRKKNKDLVRKLEQAHEYIEFFLKKCYLLKLKNERIQKAISHDEYELKKEIFLRDFRNSIEEKQKKF